MCKRIQCPEEQLNGYAWPATNSSTEVRVPCSESMTGYVSRTCGATGVWSEPEDSCRTQMCEPVTINRMSNGCMNLKFEPEAAPYVRVNVVPSSSPDLSMVFRGRTVRICGLEVKVAYSMFVEYCTDASTRELDGERVLPAELRGDGVVEYEASVTLRCCRSRRSSRAARWQRTRWRSATVAWRTARVTRRSAW